MMKKACCTILTLALGFGLVPSAFAADSADTLKVKVRTELKVDAEEKKKIISLKTQLLELRRQIIQENVKNGSLTQEQGAHMEERINARLEALKSGKLGHFHHHHCPQSKKSQ
ncbi:MAG: DUF2680 domain-containing protein [Clostridia bacterium]|nr:DUF2680 domain-containing protein [Clostridia bacterium]